MWCDLSCISDVCFSKKVVLLKESYRHATEKKKKNENEYCFICSPYINYFFNLIEISNKAIVLI